MTFDELLEYSLSKPGSWRDEPWEGDVVAKVDERIFVFLGNEAIGVKCGLDRDEADIWLHRYPDDAEVMAYIGRSGWNSLRHDGSIPREEIHEAIDDSYLLVVSRLPKGRRPEGWDIA